ncbi:MAG TPA: hypothetical protein VFU11_05110 [Solirubrobacterales bacterium]|nr:hypothetical protein [Solirubrobacterales bacterium]
MESPQIVVYVPAPGHEVDTLTIAPGSAIVGIPEVGADRVHVYFEGNRFGAVNIKTLADRALHAAGRLLQDYPTTAQMEVSRESLLAVGSFDYSGVRIVLTGPESRREVARWLSLAEFDPAELERGGAV